MTRRSIHVTKAGAGEWRVKIGGASRAITAKPTQASAENVAKAIARRTGGAEVVTHRPDGRIRSSDTIGRKDPLPPRDREH
jgi:phage tail tape-measure protein